VTPQEELAALRRLAELEAKVGMQMTIVPEDKTKGYRTPEGGVFSAEGVEVYKPTPIPSPTEGMSRFDKFAAGAKAKLADYAMGAQQLIPAMPDISQDVAEKRRIDAPLMATGAGQAGAVTGALLPMLATAGFPATNTYRGATALGGAMGLLEPTTEGASERLGNAAMGAGAGFVGQLGGNTLAALLRGGKSLISPLFQSGRNELADYIIQQQAADPLKALQAAQAYRPATEGVVPTLAESTMDPGISALQRAATGTDVADRHMMNRRVLVDLLKNMGGTDDALAAARQARKSFGESAYPAALDGVRVPNDDAMNVLMDRPSMNEAVGRSMRLGREKGLTLIEGQDIPARTEIIPGQGLPSFPGSQSYQSVSRAEDYIPGETREVPQEFKNYLASGLQYMKMSMDDIVKGTGGQGMGAHEAAAVRDTQDALGGWLEERLPAYMAANQEYKTLSQPINQMKLARELFNKAVPAGSDAANSIARLTPNSLATALREGNETLAKKAAGKWGSRVEDIFTPEQMVAVKGISSDLSREQAAYDAAMTRGSPTSRNLVTQNLIDQLGGSFGGPRTKALISALATYPLRAVDLFTAPLSQEINATIAKKLADSNLGIQALQYRPMATANNRIAEILRKATPMGAIGVYSGEQ